MQIRWVLAFAVVLATAAASSAEPRPGFKTDRHLLAQAAGYRALYTCSGLWSAGLTMPMIERDSMEKRGPSAASMLAVKDNVSIDHDRKIVSVRYLPDMPPRVAAWRPLLGCAQLPIGADPAAVAHLPRLPDDFAAPDFDQQDWPQGDRNAAKALAGPLDQALRETVARAIETDSYGGRTWAVIIVKDGMIVSEQYGLGYDMHKLQRTHSAAKSMASTLVGIAAHQGLLDVHAPAPIPEWQRPGDPRAKISVNHLLHMSSGLYTELAANPQSDLYLSGAAAAERSAGNIFSSRPGERWVYAGSDTILSVRAVRGALKDDARYLQFPFSELFWKIGMTRTFPETDWNGDYLMSGQVYSTARDFARFALLYLNDGVWGGERLLPEDWTTYVATPAPAQPDNSWVDSGCRTDCREGYGAQFWLYGPQHGTLDGAYTPRGARGQYAVVVPDRNLIIVRRGLDRYDDPPFDMVRFGQDVIRALDET